MDGLHEQPRGWTAPVGTDLGPIHRPDGAHEPQTSTPTYLERQIGRPSPVLRPGLIKIYNIHPHSRKGPQ